jgi:hypothetical protein
MCIYCDEYDHLLGNGSANSLKAGISTEVEVNFARQRLTSFHYKG